MSPSPFLSRRRHVFLPEHPKPLFCLRIGVGVFSDFWFHFRSFWCFGLVGRSPEERRLHQSSFWGCSKQMFWLYYIIVTHLLIFMQIFYVAFIYIPLLLSLFLHLNHGRWSHTWNMKWQVWYGKDLWQKIWTNILLKATLLISYITADSSPLFCITASSNVSVYPHLPHLHIKISI